MEKGLNTDNKIVYLNTQPRVLALPARCLQSNPKSIVTTVNKKNSLFILSTQFKLFAVFLVLALSIFSGAVQAENTNQKDLVFVKQIAKYSAQQAQYYSNQGLILVRQVSAMTIADKKQVMPTKTPIAIAKQDEEKQEVKSATDIKSIDKKADEFLTALNNYRQKKGLSPLQWDDKLGEYAQSRADMFNEQKGLDSHSGFNDFIHNQDGFKKLGFYSLGENSGYGHSTDPTSIIENSYGNSPSHDKNQLNPDWTNVGIGVSGTSTNFIFGGKRM